MWFLSAHFSAAVYFFRFSESLAVSTMGTTETKSSPYLRQYSFISLICVSWDELPSCFLLLTRGNAIALLLSPIHSGFTREPPSFMFRPGSTLIPDLSSSIVSRWASRVFYLSFESSSCFHF